MIVYDKEQKQIVIPNGLGNVNIIINQGCDDDKPVPPQDGWGMTGIFNNWGETPDIPFNENGEWDGRPYKAIRNFAATGGEFKIRRNNAWTDSYTASFHNEPQFAQLLKNDFSMSINDGVWDIYLFFGNDGEPNEMLMLRPGTDLSTIKYEYTLTISTDKENAIIEIADSYRGMTDRYYGGSVTVTMKYGCIYYVNIYMEGYEDISDEITCYNDEERNYTLTKIEGGEGGSCNLGDLVKEITVNGNYVYYPSNDGLDGYKMADIRINVPGGDTGAVIQDYKWVRPSMADRAENGDIYIRPDEGFDAVGYIDLDPNDIYNEGVEAGRAEGGQGSGCTLTSRTITQNGTYRASDGYSIPVINFSQNGAFNSKLKVDVINTYIEFYFAFKDERPDLISFYGSEDSDWQNTTFAARYYSGDINVKIGSFERSFNVNEYGLVDGQAHKMKVGRTYGIEIDGQMVATSDEIENGIVFTPSETRTLYIGAINSPGIEDNGLGLFWRPFNGFIGPVAIYGKREDGKQVLYNYEPGDYGWWGEYKIVETGQRIENINRQEGATPLDHKTYNQNADGYSEVTVNVPQYNLGTLDWTLTSPFAEVKNASVDGYDGYSQVTIRPENVIAQEKERAINEFKNKMSEITITQNGTYSIDDQETLHSIAFDGNSYFNTGIFPTENIKIEACIKITNGNDSGLGGIIIGGGIGRLGENTENRGIAIGMDGGAIWGRWGAARSYNKPYKYEGEGTTTVVLQKTDDSWGWEGEKGSFGASGLYIGGYNSNDIAVEKRFLQSIVYIKIWTDRNDDSTLITYTPKTNGNFDANGVELQRLGEGTTTFVEENVKKYPNGFKRVEVNIVPQISIKEEGLNVWYNDLTRITDENNQINSDWDQALQGETIQNVFPGIAMTISGQAVAKPFFIDGINGNSTATKIGKLVSTEYGTPVSCAVVIIGAFDCKNIQNVDIEAFKYMTDLCFIDGMNGLGESFISPQTINFTYCTNLFIKANNKKYISNFAESLFDLSAGNKNGINTSTLRFKSAVQERSENADAIALMRSKGWTVEFVSSDL